MSSSNKILNMFDVVMQSDMNAEEKLSMMRSLNELHTDTKKEEELAQDYEKVTNPNVTTDKPTLKVTIKPDTMNSSRTVYGHRRWEVEDREKMFRAVKDTFGPADTWSGKVTPGVAPKSFDSAMKQIAEHFGRTPLSIKSQIRDAIQPCVNSKNEASVRIGKQAAFNVGLIDEEHLNS